MRFIPARYFPAISKRLFSSQSIDVDLGADVGVGVKGPSRDNVVVISAPEVLVLQGRIVVDFRIEHFCK